MSANDPSPDLLREIRRTMTCKGYDGDVLIWERRIYDPPPVWIHLVRHEPSPSFIECTETTEVPCTEFRFHRIGVEVDNAGTWVRYTLSAYSR